MADDERLNHDNLQSEYFNSRTDIFLQPIPKAVKDKTRKIVGEAKLTTESRVLDVGTGVGVLIEHFLEFNVPEGNIVGCDLSKGMLSKASVRYPNISFWNGDFLEFDAADLPASWKGGSAFDAIFFNACFGNMFNQSEVIKHATALLAAQGIIVISHPLGKKFVKQLHESDPLIVPHFLPEKDQLVKWEKEYDLALTEFTDEIDFYLAILSNRKPA